MRRTPIHAAVAALLIVAPVASARAQEAAADSTGRVVETIKVEHADTHEPKHASLRFLNDNRVFIRAQLDLLKTRVTRERTEGAEMLDERYLRLKEMSDEIAAARDTVRAEAMLTAQRRLLASVTQLGGLERELGTLESVLGDQRQRLLALEQDFLGHQETALVVLVKGLPGKPVPNAIELSEENEIVRVELTPEQQAALEQGGIAQIYYEFVEPRVHVYSVGFDGDAWHDARPVDVTVEAQRDRLTFLELDLSPLNPEQQALGLLANVWYR